MFDSDSANSSLIFCGSLKIRLLEFVSRALIKEAIKPKPHKLK